MESESQPSTELDNESVRAKQGIASGLTAVLCWLYFVSVPGVWLLMRLAGERWWPATLLLFSPRWIWAAPLAILIPAALLLRRRMVLPAMGVGAIVFLEIMGFRIPWQTLVSRAPGGETIRLVTCNLHGTEASARILNAFVAETKPNLIVLQEYTAARSPAVLREGTWYTRRDADLFVASRYPLHEVRTPLPVDERAVSYAQQGAPPGEAACYVVELPGGTVHLINLHLASPHHALDILRADWSMGAEPLEANSERRWEESTTISDWVRQTRGPFLLAGDFNTPDDSPIFKHAWRDLNDAFSVAGFGFGTTYAKHHTWLRIDHILSDFGWSCRDCRVGPDVGSGHHPVFARLER